MILRRSSHLHRNRWAYGVQHQSSPQQSLGFLAEASSATPELGSRVAGPIRMLVYAFMTQRDSMAEHDLILNTGEVIARNGQPAPNATGKASGRRLLVRARKTLGSPTPTHRANLTT